MRPAIISQIGVREAPSSATTRSSKRDMDFSVKGIIGSTQQVQMATANNNSQSNFRMPGSIALRQRGNMAVKPVQHGTTYCFTMDDIMSYLFGKAKLKGQHVPATCASRSEWSSRAGGNAMAVMQCDSEQTETSCSICQQGTSEKCPMHGPLQSLRNLVKAQHSRPGTSDDKMQLSYAVTSFPPEVQMCESLIPGHYHGVSSRQFIPVGTWIGPYEGVRVNANELRPGTDTSYMWEIYQDGQITSYINGNDENKSSWMRFIRCARHKHEQNLLVFQYCGNIYYRAFKDISPDTELLVWYDDQYDQFMGIPTGLREANIVSTGRLGYHDMDHSPSTSVPPCPSRSNVNTAAVLPRQQNGDTASSRQRQLSVTCTSGSNVNEPAVIESLSVLTKSAGHDTADKNIRRCSVSPNSEHMESGIWRCGQCFKSFTQRSLLQIHVCPRLPEKPYQCGHCAQSFSHPTDLRTHVVTHNSERPFKCGFCGRSFAGSTTLNNHIRTHTGEKPFVCEKCNRPFSQASQLSRHQRLPGECHRNDVY